MKLDVEVLARYSHFVETEGESTWASVPLAASEARALMVDASWIRPLTTSVTIGECVSRLWQPVAHCLPRTAKGLAEQTTALAILKTAAHGVSLVYLLGDPPDFVVRRGYAPLLTLPDTAQLFPIDLRPFYGLHDGFVSLITDEQGPLPARGWTTLPHRHTGAPSLVIMAQDGSNTFGFDISESPSPAYLLRPDNDEIEVVTEPWRYLDGLMAEILEAL
jgi:hypothetical protein